MENWKIYLSKESRRKLLSDFGISASQCSLYLNFRRSSEVARRVRSKCVNFYGGVIV